ncbi:MAG: GEVED domain-containing protein [Sphingomonadales bacterium]
MKKQLQKLWFALLIFSSANFYAQYCAVTNAGGTGTFMNVVALNTLNNNTAATNPTAAPYYSSFPFGTNLVQGVTYPLSITMGPAGTYAGAIVSVWIDWNQNLTYEASEWQQVGTNIPGGTTATINIAVPLTAPVGNTGMRIRSRGNGNINGAVDACTVMGSGETEDYIVTIVSTVGCSGTPNAGAAVSGTNPVCPSVPFNLTLNGATNASGMTYQWQSAASATGPWTNITGATGPVYQATQLVNTWYQCIITCTASGQSATSAPLQVTTNSFVNCYCTSGATSAADEEILNVTLSTLNNSSICGVVAPGPGSVVSSYSNFTTAVAAPIIAPGVF